MLGYILNTTNSIRRDAAIYLFIQRQANIKRLYEVLNSLAVGIYSISF